MFYYYNIVCYIFNLLSKYKSIINLVFRTIYISFKFIIFNHLTIKLFYILFFNFRFMCNNFRYSYLAYYISYHSKPKLN